MIGYSKDWDALVAALPPRHRLLITGPHGEDRHWSVAVVLAVTPNRQLFSATGPIDLAIKHVRQRIDAYVAQGVAAL